VQRAVANRVIWAVPPGKNPGIAVIAGLVAAISIGGQWFVTDVLRLCHCERSEAISPIRSYEIATAFQASQ
jgi:hypothetical protein